MKISLKIAECGAAVMTAAMLFAQAEAPTKINIVGLEDDKDNATAEASAELGRKPEKMTISADSIIQKATESSEAESSSKVMANVKPLTTEGFVKPPSAETTKTLEMAIRDIMGQAGKQIATVSSNGIERLTMPYQQIGDAKGFEIEWRKALRLLLSPVGYNFTEDGELVLFGLAGEVDVKHKQLAQERLSANRTPILFTTNESEGGMELRNAIRDVAVKADVTITTDYMEPGDLYVPVQTVAAEGALTADDIGKAKAKSAVQQTQVKRTTFDTNGQQIEWRIVLREILNPHDYDFVEVGGVVRIAKRAKLAQWDQEAVAKKPLTAKVIRLYHADPEAVVERVMNIKGLLKHPNASLQATRKKDDNTDVVKNLNARIQTSSGQQSGMSDTTSQVFDKLVRPRTVPAVIAYDVEENMEEIEKKIRLFDVKEKQILIEAIIFQLDTDNDKGDMDGLQWELNDSELGLGNFMPLGGAIGNGAAMAKNLWDNYQARGISGNFDTFHTRNLWLETHGLDFNATIQLIRKRKNAKLLSSPMLVVGDHSEAAIQVSRVTPIPQIEASSLSGLSGSGDNVQNTLNVQWNMLRDGILMWVAPEITETGDSVRLTVHPQVVDRGDRIDLSDLANAKNKFNEYPVYNYELTMHEMDTRATVPSGATLMFGGLIKNREDVKEDKVRWLGDIPWVGWFFRSKTTEVKQENLIIMIRPTILEDADATGFETNTLKEAESVMVNSGRDLKKTPLEGPLSVKEVGRNVRDIYEERVVKPLKDEDAPQDEKPAEAPLEESAAVLSESEDKPGAESVDK